jgi:hypothetical protein
MPALQVAGEATAGFEISEVMLAWQGAGAGELGQHVTQTVGVGASSVQDGEADRVQRCRATRPLG